MPPPSLLQRLRNLLGVRLPLNAGGSRSDAQATRSTAVCLLLPRTRLEATGSAITVVPFSRPTLVVATPLNELRIESTPSADGSAGVLWQQLARSDQPIQGSIPWPLAPLQPGERRNVLLRPRGVGASEFSRLTLQAAPASELQGHETLVTTLGSNPPSWREAITNALTRQQDSLALELLFDPRQPPSPWTDALRVELLEQGCGR